MWDLRNKSKIITNFKSNFNENYRQELSLSECNRYIYTIGQDGHTRIWEKSSNNLIKTILTPNPITNHNLYADIPAVHLLDNLNILYCINKTISFYDL